MAQDTHEATIGALYAKWVEATNAKDIDLWASFVAPEAIFLPPGHPLLEGKSDITSFYEGLFADELFALDCAQERVFVSEAEDLAWSAGRCAATFTGPDGDAAHDKSKWAKVWQRQPNGRWLCIMNSWSSTYPASGR